MKYYTTVKKNKLPQYPHGQISQKMSCERKLIKKNTWCIFPFIKTGQPDLYMSEDRYILNSWGARTASVVLGIFYFFNLSRLKCVFLFYKNS